MLRNKIVKLLQNNLKKLFNKKTNPTKISFFVYYNPKNTFRISYNLQIKNAKISGGTLKRIFNILAKYYEIK